MHHSTTSITATQAELAQAFETWEIDYRANGGKFYTPEETAQLEVATLSEGRAIHLMALLRNQGAHIKAAA